VPHSDDLPVQLPPENKDLLEDDDEHEIACCSETDNDFEPECDFKEPHLVDQSDLNDLVRDLYLSKQQAELLASRLKQWNLTQPNVRVTHFRKRNEDLVEWFTI
jgi:hypothetical protein